MRIVTDTDLLRGFLSLRANIIVTATTWSAPSYCTLLGGCCWYIYLCLPWLKAACTKRNLTLQSCATLISDPPIELVSQYVFGDKKKKTSQVRDFYFICSQHESDFAILMRSSSLEGDVSDAGWQKSLLHSPSIHFFKGLQGTRRAYPSCHQARDRHPGQVGNPSQGWHTERQTHFTVTRTFVYLQFFSSFFILF